METLEDILNFRAKNKGKCVSTTHWISLLEYCEIAVLLPNFFNEFRFYKRTTPPAGIAKDKIIELTIQI